MLFPPDIESVDEERLEEQANYLFEKAPIRFRPRKENSIDAEIKLMIDQMQITIPIIWIKQSLYLVGTVKLNLVKKGEYVMAKVAGGYEKLEKYI